MSWEETGNVKGPKGDKGPAGTISSVSVVSLQPGEPATATLVGGEEVHLTLGVPRGDRGPQGPPGVASSASARSVPYGHPANAIPEQHGEAMHFKFDIPEGAPGPNAVPAAEAVGAYLGSPSSPSRPGLEQGMQQVAADPSSDFAVKQKELLDSGLAGKANLSDGRVPDVEMGASTEATPDTIPKRAAGGTLPGIGTPAVGTDAANKQYVDAAIERLPTFNVRDFGAIGDGVTDDRDAVQSAVDAALAFGGGGTVEFPPAKYVLSGFVELSSNITVSGYGATLLKPAVRDSVAFFAIRTGANRGYGAGGRNISILGITTFGRAFAGESATLLSAHHASQVTVRDCVGILSVARGHWIDLNGCDGVLVENCTLFGAAIVTGTFPGEAIQPDVSEAGSLSVPEDSTDGFDGLPSRNVTVRSSAFRQYVHEGVIYPAPVAYGTHTSPTGGRYYENLSFIDCICEPTQERTSGVRGAVHFISTDGVLIRDSFFDGGAVKAELVHIQEGYGDGGTVPSKNIKIESNSFRGGRSTQVAIAAGENVLISGNNLEGFGGSPSAGFAHGISFATAPKQFAVIGNTLQSNASPHTSARALYYNGGSAKEGLASGNVMSGPAGSSGGGGNSDGRVVSTGNLPS